jgi:Fur family transcriptional regulator, ferric uptake regulator
MLVKNIVSSLRRAGHKVTPQRLTIINVFSQSLETLTPAALYEKVRRIDPAIGEVTVYRTLNILAELGLMCMIHTGENTHSYIIRPPEHHDHLICSNCGRVYNFTNCNVKDLEKRLFVENGFQIEDHRLDFYGRCRDCLIKT